MDNIIEVLFLADLCFCFVWEVQDHETYSVITDVKLIAKQYLRGNFIFDFLAVCPFDWFLEPDTKKYRLYRLFKLLRVRRLA